MSADAGSPIGPRVVVQEWVSVNGMASGIGGEMDVMGVVDEAADARSQEYNRDLLADAAGILLGSATYRQFVEYWPTAEEPIAPYINSLPKFVASRSGEAVPWGAHAPATRVDDAAAFVREHRSAGTGTLVIWGSLALAESLIEAHLVDEIDLFVAPVWIDDGSPAIGWGDHRLEQLVSEDWGSITHIRYRFTDAGRA